MVASLKSGPHYSDISISNITKPKDNFSSEVYEDKGERIFFNLELLLFTDILCS